MVSIGESTAPSDEWLRDTVTMVVEQGYRVVPVYCSNKTQPYANSQTYPDPLTHEWQSAIAVGVVLDGAVLLDYDGNKADESGSNIIGLAELAARLGLEDMPQAVQEGSSGRSLHFLFRRCEAVGKVSADGKLSPFVDIKTGNQLMHLKPHKVINDGELPKFEELTDCPEAILDLLKINSMGRCPAITDVSAALKNIAEGHNVHENALAVVNTMQRIGKTDLEIVRTVEPAANHLRTQSGRNDRCTRADRLMGGELEDIIQSGRTKFTPVETSVGPLATTLLRTKTEDGVAQAFSHHFADRFVYMHGLKKWASWTGTRWLLDDIGAVPHEIRNLARVMNNDNRKDMAKAGFVRGVESLLQNDPAHARHAAIFDADTNLLNTPAATIDLDQMTPRPHSPSDCITQITRCSPSNHGGTRFRQFMVEITDDDHELIEFHQMSLGACLSGAAETHWLLFWYGALGRNGKNTLGDTVAWVLGSYAGTLPSSALMSKSRDDHPTELMLLKGRRLVVSSEVPEGAFWNEARLKELTGDEMLNARGMRQDFIAFRRTHKHLIYGNHQPRLRNIDLAVQARFKLVPFPVSFLGREDPLLVQKLKAEGGYILFWLLEGHRKFVENNLRLPNCQAVELASKEYFSSQSTIDAWFEERCSKVDQSDLPKSLLTKAGAFYCDYQEWKKRRGEVPQSMTHFGGWLGQRFEKVQSNGMRYRGVQLMHLSPEAGH